MFKVKIKSNIRAEVINRLRKTVDEKFIEDMNREAIGEAKRLINSGQSPVRGYEAKRFKGYKNPDKYPSDRKAKRPVNLVLTGAMIFWYRVVKISGVRISFGIPTNAPDDVKARAEANNVGTTNAAGEIAIAPRRFIPLAGETFAVSVIRKMKKVYAARIKALILKK